MKRVFIVYCWGGAPKELWYPWLKGELEQRGWSVSVLEMPDPEHPRIEPWVSALSQAVGTVDEETFFVGHSVGCQTILRYLAPLSADAKIGGAVLVAPWLTLQGLEEEEEPVAKPWLTIPIDEAAVRRFSDKIVAIFSDNDPLVPLENEDVFKNRFGIRRRIEHGAGHFDRESNTTELPVALDELLALAK